METAKQHYVALRQYLASHLIKEQSQGISPQRQSAREKLIRLTQQQFQELSTDVFDELTRRLLNSPTVPFLALKDDYHPKRNQARQKLATLPKARFKDLASDVYAELDRRYPVFSKEWNTRITEGDTAPHSPQSKNMVSPPSSRSRTSPAISGATTPVSPSRKIEQPMSMQSTTSMKSSNSMHSMQSMTSVASMQSDSNMLDLYEEIVPIKEQAMIISDDKLEYTVHTYQDSVSNANESLQPPYSVTNDRFRPSSEVEMLRNRVRELEDRMLSSNYDDPAIVSDLKHQLKELHQKNADLEDKYAFLTRNYNELKNIEPRVISNRAADGMAALIETSSQLSKENEELTDWKGENEHKIKALTDENTSLKKRLEIHRSELRALRDSEDFVINHPKTDFARNSIMSPSSEGYIDQKLVVKYQLAIDKLLHAARYETATNTLVSMKSVIVAIREITEVSQECEHHGGTATIRPDALVALQARMSKALTVFVTAVKKHAEGFGVFPVSILESCSITLSETVIEVVQQLRIRASTYKEPTASDFDYIANDEQQQRRETIIPESQTKKEELRAYLEQRTDAIIQAIQALLTTMRAPTVQAEELVDILESINDIVLNVVKLTRKRMPKRAESVLEQLEDSNEKLIELREGLPESGLVSTVENKQILASASFEIAKHLKNLLSIFEQ